MERVELRGVKDGVEVVLGTINETPAMYARRLIVDWFGPFTNGDDSDADYVRQMVGEVLQYAYQYEPDYDMKETV
jgi:hypothetical protein